MGGRSGPGGARGESGGGVVGGGGSKFGKVAGIAMSAVMLAMAAEFGYTVGKSMLDKMLDSQKVALDKNTSEEADHYARVQGIKKNVLAGGSLSEEDETYLRARRVEGAGREAVAEMRGEGPAQAIEDMMAQAYGAKSEEQLARERSDTATLEQLRADNKLMTDLLRGTLRVHVENASEIASAAGSVDGYDIPGRVSPPVPGPGPYG